MGSLTTLLIFLILSNHVWSSLSSSLSSSIKLDNENQDNSAPMAQPAPRISNTFKPSIAIIVGILTTIFSITFLLLLYFKHCKNGGLEYSNALRGGNHHPPSRTNSGINRKVIESLPLFRFSSLRGQKDGLECSVCLNKFEPDEVLRLLPKCKHAFHVECVDTWLDGHSTCPLCRYRVDAEDVLLVDSRALYNNNNSTSHSGHATPRNSDQGSSNGKLIGTARISGRHSYAGEKGSSLEIIVENPAAPAQDFRGRVSLDSWNSRRIVEATDRSKSWNSSRDAPRKSGKLPEKPSKESRKDGQLPVKGDRHRLEHRIIVSGEAASAEGKEGQRRWSDAQGTDLLYLRSEMILGAEGGNGGRGLINGRSLSEITGMSRYRSNNGGGRERQVHVHEEGVVKRWLDHHQQQQQHRPAVAVGADSAISSSSSPSVGWGERYIESII